MIDFIAWPAAGVCNWIQITSSGAFSYTRARFWKLDGFPCTKQHVIILAQVNVLQYRRSHLPA
jgi:hypothetical protein